MVGSFRVARSARGDKAVLSVAGRLSAPSAPELVEAVDLALRERLPVVLDLTRLTGINGTGLGALVKAKARAAAAGRSLTVENPPGPVAALLSSIGLASWLGVARPTTDGGQASALPGWMPPLETITVGPITAGARSLNVHGRRPSGPALGFGPLWHKTYTLRVPAGLAVPERLVDMLRSDLPALQPSANRFYPVGGQMSPGSVVLINARVLGMPMLTGVVVMHSDEEEFSLLTPRGHPESGWVTFSARSDQPDGPGVTVRIESLARASDPVYEFALRFLGAGSVQEGIWRHVLAALAQRLDVPADVSVAKQVLDPCTQWSRAANLFYNAGAWTMPYALIGRA